MKHGGKSIKTFMVYGVSGSGKTTQAGELAKAVYKRTGKPTRLVSASGGGWAVVDALVDLDIIIPTYIVDRPRVFETVSKMSRGWWPKDPNDPKSLLVPPDTGDNKLEEIGCYIFDSLTEIASLMMEYAIHEESQGNIKISGQHATSKFKDGDEYFGSSSMSMYGSIQNYMESAVRKSSSLPGTYVMWTALERKAIDDKTKLLTFGPDVIGEAKTASCPAWFNNVLHLQMVQDKGELKRRMFLKSHLDGQTPCYAKTTVPFDHDNSSNLPAFLHGRDLSMMRFLDILEEQTELAKEAEMKRISKQLNIKEKK